MANGARIGAPPWRGRTALDEILPETEPGFGTRAATASVPTTHTASASAAASTRGRTLQ